MIFAGTEGYLDDMPVNRIGPFEQALLADLRGNRQDLLDDITNNDRDVAGRKADKDLNAKIRSIIENVKNTFAG